MTYFDIFNGDADGLCALHQLRLSEPHASTLITGTKRDTALVARVRVAAGDHLTILDVGLAQNRDGVRDALAAGASCLYFDHHFPGEGIQHPALECHINTDPAVCTSLLVDEYLGSRHSLWAITAAFGDGLGDVAARRCRELGLSAADVDLLRNLGEALNYNAYGESLQDLHYAPAELYRLLAPFPDPRAFAHECNAFMRLREAYQSDLSRALEVPALLATATHLAVALPDASWSRRVNGVLAHHLADSVPSRAHAVLVRMADHYLVSVRAPRNRPEGTDALCRQFATGGGRAGAGGINRLPVTQVDRFLMAFQSAFGWAASGQP